MRPWQEDTSWAWFKLLRERNDDAKSAIVYNALIEFSEKKLRRCTVDCKVRREFPRQFSTFNNVILNWHFHVHYFCFCCCSMLIRCCVLRNESEIKWHRTFFFVPCRRVSHLFFCYALEIFWLFDSQEFAPFTRQARCAMNLRVVHTSWFGHHLDSSDPSSALPTNVNEHHRDAIIEIFRYATTVLSWTRLTFSWNVFNLSSDISCGSFLASLSLSGMSVYPRLKRI